MASEGATAMLNDPDEGVKIGLAQMQQIASILRESFKEDMKETMKETIKEQLPEMAKNIVSGVIDGLNKKISDL